MLSLQVRFKALCLIEASIRQRDDNNVLDSVTAMFEEDASTIVDSLQSPQATLRDKAKKVNTRPPADIGNGIERNGMGASISQCT